MYSLCSFNGARLLHLHLHLHGARTRTRPTEHRPTHPHQRPPLQAHRRAACGARGAASRQSTKAPQKIYKTNRGSASPAFHGVSAGARQVAAARCCHLLTPVPVPGPSKRRYQDAPRDGTERCGQPTPAPPRPTTAGGRVDKQTQRPPVPCPPHSFLLLPSPLLASSARSPLPFSCTRACLRAPRWPGRTDRRARRARDGCTDLRPACPGRWGEVASAFRNGQLVVPVSFAYAFSIAVVFRRRP